MDIVDRMDAVDAGRRNQEATTRCEAQAGKPVPPGWAVSLPLTGRWDAL